MVGEDGSKQGMALEASVVHGLRADQARWNSFFAGGGELNSAKLILSNFGLKF